MELLYAVFTMCLNQVIQSHYGALGVLCLLLLGASFKARNMTCFSAAAVVFLLMMTQA